MPEQIDPALAAAAQFDDPAVFAVCVFTAPQQSDQRGEQGYRDQDGIPETVNKQFDLQNRGFTNQFGAGTAGFRVHDSDPEF